MPQPGFIPPHMNADGTYMPPGKDDWGARGLPWPCPQCVIWAAVQPLVQCVL